MRQQIVLGGGCFWCVEAVFVQLVGVESVESGYTGGHVNAPTYNQVCEGDSGHIEVVRVTYEDTKLSLEDIFAVFFATHDPTALGRQGNDVGPQYASAIFYANLAQRAVAQAFIDRLTADNVFAEPITTTLLLLDEFWPAEDYHVDYFALHPEQGYCQYVIAPKIAQMRQKFAHCLKLL
jgi:peptide-methionine (S)-S-oxide reductase